MPLRMAIDAGVVAPADVALVGARNLDPPEVAFIERTGIDDDRPRARGATRVYVAFDCDVLGPASSPSSCRSRAGRRSPRRSELAARIGEQARSRASG